MIDVASAERCRRILERANAAAEMNHRKEEAMKSPDSVEGRLGAAIENI